MSIKEFWRQFEQQPAAAGEATLPPYTPTQVNGNAHAYAAAALRGEASDVATHPQGGRNERLNLAWFRLGQHIGAGNIDIDTVRAQLWEAGQACGLPDAEIATCLRDGPTSAATAGAQHPRHPTPRDDTAPELAELQPATDSEGGPLLNQCIDWAELWATEDDGEEWIVEPILPARRMVALYSAPKAGKSLLVLEMAVAISRGTEILGRTPDRPRRVLYVDFENDPRGDIRTRLQNMDLEPHQLHNLLYLSYPQLAKFDTAQGALDLMRHVEHYECEVVIIDTVSRAVSGEENDNDTWLAFYRNTGLLLKQAGIACLRLDHSGKDKEKGMRGGSAKAGDVDAVWQLSVVGDETILLECTHHRMQVPDKRLLVTREEWPLKHVVKDDTRDALATAKAVDLDRLLDALGIPHSATNDAVKTALKESGHTGRGAGFGGNVIRSVVANRKMRLDVPTQNPPP